MYFYINLCVIVIRKLSCVPGISSVAAVMPSLSMGDPGTDRDALVRYIWDI